MSKAYDADVFQANILTHIIHFNQNLSGSDADCGRPHVVCCGFLSQGSILYVLDGACLVPFGLHR